MPDDFSARTSDAAGSLGLDFGTTNSVAALVRPDGSVETATVQEAISLGVPTDQLNVLDWMLDG